MTEEERFPVADHAVAQLKERGDPWRLNEEGQASASAFSSGTHGLQKYCHQIILRDQNGSSCS